MQYKIPKEVSHVTSALKNRGFEAYLVGGCVRDLKLKKNPKDWDITTNANPEQILEIFGEQAFYENNFGTVGVKNENASCETLKVVEVTPYRKESKYTNKRHPDSVSFSQKIEDDLKRRDFTVNAMAMDTETGEIIDLYEGGKDLESQIIKTVGDPNERFKEDALRMLRAIRFQAELGFTIEAETQKSIENNSELLKHISWERIGDEFSKIIMSSNPAQAIDICQKIKLLSHILPELEECMSIEQGGVHKYDVYEHSLRTLQHSSDKVLGFHVRLAALLHDIGKPKSRRKGSGNKNWTFYGHEVVGERISKKILERLKISRETREKTLKLVRYHMFFSDTEEISHSAVRRLISKVGKELIQDLINLRMCDRIGIGRPKEEPYRLRKYQAMIDEVMSDPLSVGMLKINGDILINKFHMKPGKRIGWLLHALLEEVLDDPTKNEEKYLGDRVKELNKLEDKDLERLGQKGKEEKEIKEKEKISKINRKHKVK